MAKNVTVTFFCNRIFVLKNVTTHGVYIYTVLHFLLHFLLQKIYSFLREKGGLDGRQMSTLSR